MRLTGSRGNPRRYRRPSAGPNPSRVMRISNAGPSSVPYRSPGADHFLRADREKMAKRLVRKLTELDFDVNLNAA